MNGVSTAERGIQLHFVASLTTEKEDGRGWQGAYKDSTYMGECMDRRKEKDSGSVRNMGGTSKIGRAREEHQGKQGDTRLRENREKS